MSSPYASSMPVASIGVDERATFITRTYTHLFGAVLAFVLIEVYFFSTGLAESIARAMLGVSWLLVLGGFMVVSWIASHVAGRSRSMGAQYAALGAFVLAEAIIFVPLLYMAQYHAPGTIESAATVTMIAFKTRKDFSFLGGLLRWGFLVALLLIAGAVLFGFNLGTFFSVAMVGLAGGAILYDTSNVLHHYPQDRYVGASLALFASVALMLWYVLRLFMASDD